MSNPEKKGFMKGIIDRMRDTNWTEHGAKADTSTRLGYEKGNFDQTQVKKSNTWETCPVLDEQGNPIQHEDEEQPS